VYLLIEVCPEGLLIANFYRNPGVLRPAEQSGVSDAAARTNQSGVNTRKPGSLGLETKENQSEKFVLLGRPARRKVEVKTRGAATRRTNVRSRGVVARLPPEIMTTTTCHSTLRFQVITSTITSTTINSAQLIGACGVIGKVVNTSVSSIASTFRVKRVTIWPSVSTSVDAIPEISWGYPSSTDVGKDVSWMSSVPTGVSQTGPVVSVPPKGSLCSVWFRWDSSQADLFTLLNIPVGSILDLSISFTLRNNLAGADISVITAVVGSMYYLYLDGAKIQPVGRPTTL